MLYEPNLYTIYNNILQFLPKKNEYEIEKIYNNGSLILLKKYIKLSNTKTIVFIPGTTGDTENKLIAIFIDFFSKCHYNIIFIIQQGQVITKDIAYSISKPHFISINDITDLTFAMNYIKTKYNNITMVGISLGSFLMLKYILTDNTIKCAVSISSLWNLRKTFDFWNTSYIKKQLYENYFINHCKKLLLNNIKIFKKYEKENTKFSIKKYMNSTSMKDILTYLNIIYYGYDNIDKYLDDAVIDIKKLNKTNVPILYFHCIDDPVCNFYDIPIKKILKNNKNIFMLYEQGGHSTYIQNIELYILNFLNIYT